MKKILIGLALLSALTINCANTPPKTNKAKSALLDTQVSIPVNIANPQIDTIMLKINQPKKIWCNATYKGNVVGHGQLITNGTSSSCILKKGAWGKGSTAPQTTIGTISFMDTSNKPLINDTLLNSIINKTFNPKLISISFSPSK